MLTCRRISRCLTFWMILLLLFHFIVLAPFILVKQVRKVPYTGIETPLTVQTYNSLALGEQTVPQTYGFESSTLKVSTIYKSLSAVQWSNEDKLQDQQADNRNTQVNSSRNSQIVHKIKHNSIKRKRQANYIRKYKIRIDTPAFFSNVKHSKDKSLQHSHTKELNVNNLKINNETQIHPDNPTGPHNLNYSTNEHGMPNTLDLTKGFRLSGENSTLGHKWKLTPDVVVHLPLLEWAKTHSYSGDVGVAKDSLNKDIVARGVFQQTEVHKFCQRHRLSDTLPKNRDELNTTLEHLLYDDSRKLIFCYVPKTGCSNLKWMLLTLNGTWTHSDQQHRPPEALLNTVNSLVRLPPEEIKYRLENYYKVATVRNPVHRLLSAYRNKLEHPFEDSQWNRFPDSMKMKILRDTRGIEAPSWAQFLAKINNLTVTFTETVNYLSSQPFSLYNEHFSPMLHLCQPCAVKYHFYPNFKVLSYDISALLSLVGIPSDYYPFQLSKSPSYETIAKRYFHDHLSVEERNKIFRKLALELDFYYSLYPEDSGYHELMY